MKKIIKSLLCALLVGALAGPSWMYGAASGHYTDLLPVGAASDTTVISNGSGWSLTTLPPTQTFGDALSRIPTVVYQLYSSTAIANTTNVSTFTALSSVNSVGSVTFPASWVQVGRSIRVFTEGYYSTTGTPNWTWDIYLGTMSVLTTGAIAAPTTQTKQRFSAIATVTIASTTAASQVNAVYDINVSSGNYNTPVLNFSTATMSAVTVDWNVTLQVYPHFTWGTANASNSLNITNCWVEFLN